MTYATVCKVIPRPQKGKQTSRSGCSVSLHRDARASRCLSRGSPVVSVEHQEEGIRSETPRSPGKDGSRSNASRSMCMTSPTPDMPKAVPSWRLYDRQRNEGWVTVGCPHGRVEFCRREHFVRRWREMGHPLHPEAEGGACVRADSGIRRVMATAFGLWKVEMQHWANEAGFRT